MWRNCYPTWTDEIKDNEPLKGPVEMIQSDFPTTSSPIYPMVPTPGGTIDKPIGSGKKE